MGRETELGVCFCKWFAMYCEEKNIRLYEENECQRRRSSPVCVRRSTIVRRTIIVILRNQLVLLFLSIICHRIVASTWFMGVTRQRDISSRRNQHSLHWFHSIMGFCHNFFCIPLRVCSVWCLLSQKKSGNRTRAKPAATGWRGAHLRMRVPTSHDRHT